jgi:hypothetical protein
MASTADTLSEENFATLRQRCSHVGGEYRGLLTSSVVSFSVRPGLRTVAPTCQCRRIVANQNEPLPYVPCIGSAFDKTWQCYSSTWSGCRAGSGVEMRSDVAAVANCARCCESRLGQLPFGELQHWRWVDNARKYWWEDAGSGRYVICGSAYIGIDWGRRERGSNTFTSHLLFVTFRALLSARRRLPVGAHHFGSFLMLQHPMAASCSCANPGIRGCLSREELRITFPAHPP